MKVMRLWATEFKAICAFTGELKTYVGPNVPGINKEDAQQWCHDNEGHLVVVGELVAEIPFDDDKSFYYETIQNN